MPDTVNNIAKTTIIGLPFENRKKELIKGAVADDNPDSTGVIDEEIETV